MTKKVIAVCNNNLGTSKNYQKGSCKDSCKALQEQFVPKKGGSCKDSCKQAKEVIANCNAYIYACICKNLFLLI